MKQWKPYEEKFLPLHEDLASGEHPEHGAFRLMISVPPGGLYVSLVPGEDGAGETELYELTTRDLMDGFFEYLEGRKAEKEEESE